VRNCVAIGDSAVTIEPLEWTNLHLAHSAIDRLVAMMPDADCNPTELWDYNRQTNAELDRARDFVLLHYAVSNRPEPFWQDASSRPLPASLEHTLLQWRERGRLPFFEEETFTRDSWAAVLIGQGVIPRRIDPLLTSVPERESACSMEQLRNAIQSAVTRAPTQGIYLRNLSLQGTR
jgi:tryptophan halogenase